MTDNYQTSIFNASIDAATLEHMRQLLAERDERIAQLENSHELEDTFAEEKRLMEEDFNRLRSDLERELTHLREETAMQRARIDIYLAYERENEALRQRIRALSADLRTAQTSAEAVASLSRSELLSARASLAAEYRRRLQAIEGEARKSVAQLVPQEARAALEAAAALQAQMSEHDRGIDRVVSELRGALRESATATSAAAYAQQESEEHAQRCVALQKKLDTERARTATLESEVRVVRATAAAASRLERLVTEKTAVIAQLESQLSEAQAQVQFWKTRASKAGQRRDGVVGTQNLPRLPSRSSTSDRIGQPPLNASAPIAGMPQIGEPLQMPKTGLSSAQQLAQISISAVRTPQLPLSARSLSGQSGATVQVKRGIYQTDRHEVE